MKKFIALLIVLAFVFVLSPVSFAQTAQKIAYVDLSRVFDEYNKTGDFDKVLEEKSVKYQKERNSKLEKIQEAERKLTLLKESERQKLQDQIQKNKDALLGFDRKNQTDLRKERDEKIREILLEIEGVVKSYAEKEKYDLILNDRVLIYGSKNIELTDIIVGILNKK
ncbi:MAG: OmpH family outer membrane protein [Candidatus Aceula meridiana]|nr:OmpH family outer membrane protein [Candidatus Aceula meridiana]